MTSCWRAASTARTRAIASVRTSAACYRVAQTLSPRSGLEESREQNEKEAGIRAHPLRRYVDLHVQSNPSVDTAEFAHRLRQAVDAQGTGALCLWSIHLGDRIGRGRRRML
jgi:hypothetical protein